MEGTMRAVAAGRTSRRPKTYGEHRVCDTEGCSTNLSRYNRETHCFQHAPATFRRLRGEFTPEYAAGR